MSINSNCTSAELRPVASTNPNSGVEPKSAGVPLTLLAHQVLFVAPGNPEPLNPVVLVTVLNVEFDHRK